jgi:hypothetical protein
MAGETRGLRALAAIERFHAMQQIGSIANPLRRSAAIDAILAPMRYRIAIGVVIWAIATAGTSAAAFAGAGPCGDSLTHRIPARPATALGGRAFTEQIRGLDGDERETRIQYELLSGNIPNFLRRLVPVTMHQSGTGGPAVDIVLCVAPDYLAIGSDEDFLLIPVRLGTALRMAEAYGFVLPTPLIADAVYAQARARFVPQPLPASDQMRSTDYYSRHNELVSTQRTALGIVPGTLSAGDKKDLVLTNRLWSHLDRVAIYGWHRSDGTPIQTLSTVHGWHYADYSHGARLISTQVFVNGRSTSIFDVLQNPRLAGTLSADGVIRQPIDLIDTLSARAQASIATALSGALRTLQ